MNAAAIFFPCVCVCVCVETLYTSLGGLCPKRQPIYDINKLFYSDCKRQSQNHSFGKETNPMQFSFSVQRGNLFKNVFITSKLAADVSAPFSLPRVPHWAVLRVRPGPLFLLIPVYSANEEVNNYC